MQTVATVFMIPHRRLHDVVAVENGYFRDEGIAIRYGSSMEADGFPRLGSETLAARNDIEMVNTNCSWGACNTSGAGKGKVVAGNYSITDFGIFVRNGSRISKIEDLANIEVGVGKLSGSHFTTLETLEKFLPRKAIRIAFVGGPDTRLRMLVNGEIEVATLVPAPFYVAKELGLQSIYEGKFKSLNWVSNSTKKETVTRYFKAIARAQGYIDEHPEEAKRYWVKQVPEEYRTKVDVSKFGVGERIVFEPYTKEQYNRQLKWMKSWNLTERMTETAYEKIML